MSAKKIETVILDETVLLPRAWEQPGEYSCFNPALTRFRKRWLLVYRVVTPDAQRRLAICALDPATWQPMPETVLPLSDFIPEAGSWQADPRFCIFGERLLVHFNNGYRRLNQIYLTELDPDTLAPRSSARPLMLEESRQKVEKNWMLFEHAGDLWAVYSIDPHVVLKLELGASGPVCCRRAYLQDWAADSSVAHYRARFGIPRGSAPPVRVGDEYVSIFHSSYAVRPLRRLWLKLLRRPRHKTLRYVGGLYGFAAEPPFSPRWMRPSPLLFPPRLPRRRRVQLDQRVERSAYPGGAVLHNRQWIVSYGSQEEYCCLAFIDRE